MTGALATELYGLAARAAGVTMRAGNIGATKAEAITVGMFAGAHIIAACVVIPLIRAGLPTTK